MARPQKETVDYFPHDSRASDGTTLTILDSKFGNDGYSFWFRLLERLSATPGHFIDCRNPAVWEFLQAKTHLNEDIVSSLLKLLAELGAIDKELWDSKIIWCQNLVDNVADVYKNRRTNTPQKPNTDGRNPTPALVSTGENPTPAVVSTDESTQSKVKETKVNKSRVTKTNNKQPKHTYGQFKNVHLTDNEKRKLLDRFGDEGFEEKVENLSLGIESRGYKYKSHYAAILSWDRMDGKAVGKNAGVNKVNSDDPNKYTKGKYGHMVNR